MRAALNSHQVSLAMRHRSRPLDGLQRAPHWALIASFAVLVVSSAIAPASSPAGHAKPVPTAPVEATGVGHAKPVPTAPVEATGVGTAAIEFYERKVRPLLVANCYTCHSAETNSKGGLRVDDRNGLLVGGSRGPAIRPGKPDESLLIKAVSYRGKLKMPPERPLEESEVAILKRWIQEGAPWPKVESVVVDRSVTADYERLREEHCACEPPQNPQ